MSRFSIVSATGMMTRLVSAAMLAGAILWSATLTPGVTHAGLGGFGQQQAVGGVMIDPDGTVRAATPDEQRQMASVLQTVVGQPQGDVAQNANQRVVSLKRLQEALLDSRQNQNRMTPEIEFLAGLQRIEYVVVDDVNDDLLLVGPAEPWELKPDGSVVGRTSGHSVLRLEDLMTAFRSVETARQDGGIRCSIEPTADGRARLQNLLANVKLRPNQNPAFLEAAMREAFGPQQILLAGVPEDSRFARTMVAADFEMKRIAMGLVDSPLPGLPSYLEISRNARQSASQNPRWWMACNYDPIARDDSGRVWKLSGQGVKTLTEDDVVEVDGSVAAGGRQNKLAAKWADMMTKQYDELSQQKPIFRDLRNVIDMAVVATLVRQESLDTASGLDLSVLRGEAGELESVKFAMPKTLAPQCSFVRGNAGWTVTASGGVNVNAFGIVDQQVTDANLQTLVVTTETTDRWWWDAN